MQNWESRPRCLRLGVVPPGRGTAAEPQSLLACPPGARFVPALLEAMKEGPPPPIRTNRQRLAFLESLVSDE